jgi:class 3 adenylate cyclase
MPPVRTLAIVATALVTPLVLIGIVRVQDHLDVSWENHPAHFWLVLGAASVCVALGYAVGGAARRRRDARLLFISLAFVASSGFLGLHALATPGVLIGKNPGFELATPFGLALAGVFAAVSALELPQRTVAAAPWLLGGLGVLIAAWGVVSIAEVWPLDSPVSREQLDGYQVVLAVVGLLFYTFAAGGYFRLYVRRRQRFVLAVAVAFGLLAEAMFVIAWASNWRLSWWEWHVLMATAFGAIALAARGEWHEERFSALYLDQTLAGARDVSILLADLTGFTSFSERHEPTEVTAMLNTYFERLVPLMERSGGEVHQIVGDELMVIFNKQSDTPDHPARAARAGLLLQEAAGEVARPDWPTFRVGVNSGEVLAAVVGGPRGHRKHGVVGDTVNLAARLETSAPVGGVLIGEATFRRLPSGTLAERVPPLRVKGKDEEIEAYVLRSVGTGDPMADHEPEPQREDDRNEELDESPVPDPEQTDGDAEDDPQAD